MTQDIVQENSKSSKELFGKMPLKQLESVYTVIARSALPGVASDWKSEIEEAVDKHIDSYEKASKKGTDEKSK
jgi:hypothetical protein